MDATVSFIEASVSLALDAPILQSFALVDYLSILRARGPIVRQLKCLYREFQAEDVNLVKGFRFFQGRLHELP